MKKIGRIVYELRVPIILIVVMCVMHTCCKIAFGQKWVAEQPADQLTWVAVEEKLEPKKLTYEDAYRLAMKTEKPLLVWVGGNFCERCVQDSENDFVHCFVDEFPGAINPSIVVAVKDGDKLERVGDVQWWIVGDKEFGHIPSVRTAIRNWRERRATRIAPVSASAYPAQFPFQQGPMMWNAVPQFPSQGPMLQQLFRGGTPGPIFRGIFRGPSRGAGGCSS
jgi:hypothetical protein